MGLILNNAAITVRIGGNYDGSAPTFTGTGVNFMARAREFRVTDSLEKTNVSGAGHARKRHRFHSAEGTLMLKGVVQALTGFAFKAVGAVTPVGKWVEVTTVPLSTMTTPDIYIGVITKWEESGSATESIFEEIEIDLNADVETV